MNIPEKSPVRIYQDSWELASGEEKPELVGTTLTIPITEIGTRSARIAEQGRVGDELVIKVEYTEQ